MAFQFKKRLAGLPHVEYTNDARVLAEGCEEMGVVRRGGDS